jgi:hypothetical protein
MAWKELCVRVYGAEDDLEVGSWTLFAWARICAVRVVDL